MVRDEEISRLISYVKGLGLTVTFCTSKEEDDSAAWYLDNTGIMINKQRNKSKIDTVLTLIHEIGHAKHNLWEKNREIDPTLENAIDHVDKAEELEQDSKKKQRKVLLNHEIGGTKYWNEIYHETNMKFPMWKLDLAKEYDVWQYEVFYETGSYPKYKERRKKHKELTKKYRKANV